MVEEPAKKNNNSKKNDDVDDNNNTIFITKGKVKSGKEYHRNVPKSTAHYEILMGFFVVLSSIDNHFF